MFNGVVSFLFGLFTIIFIKKISELGIKWQYFLTKRQYPLYSFIVPTLIVGIGFIIIGLIDIFKYIKR